MYCMFKKSWPTFYGKVLWKNWLRLLRHTVCGVETPSSASQRYLWYFSTKNCCQMFLTRGDGGEKASFSSRFRIRFSAKKNPDPGLCTLYEGRFFKFQRMNIKKNRSPESGFKQKLHIFTRELRRSSPETYLLISVKKRVPKTKCQKIVI